MICHLSELTQVWGSETAKKKPESGKKMLKKKEKRWACLK